jgi:hypothetical protein
MREGGFRGISRKGAKEERKDRKEKRRRSTFIPFAVQLLFFFAPFALLLCAFA